MKFKLIDTISRLWGMVPAVRRRREAVAAVVAQEERDARKVRERTLGGRASAQLALAASENLQHCTANGLAGPMKVHEFPQSGNGYLVKVWLADENGRPDAFVAVNFSVSVHRDQVHVLWNLQGRSTTGTLEDFDRLLKAACVHVRQWRLYASDRVAA